MLKLVKTVYKSVVSITDLVAVATSYGTNEAKRYIAETLEVNNSIRESINLAKVEAILAKMSDISEMDIPAAAKESALAKLQSMLNTELTL